MQVGAMKQENLSHDRNSFTPEAAQAALREVHDKIQKLEAALCPQLLLNRIFKHLQSCGLC